MKKKPLLNNLRGVYTLSKQERQNCDIPQGLFTTEAKNWSNLKTVAQEYLEKVEEYGTAQDTLALIDITLDRITNKLKSKKGTAKLLFDYCQSLKEYYKDNNVQKWFRTHYDRKELQLRHYQKLRNATLQSRSLALTIAMNEDREIEQTLADNGMAVKRKLDAITSDEEEPDITEKPGIDEEPNTDKERDTDEESAIEEEPENEDSFSSVEKHPSSLAVYNYFAQDSQQPWPAGAVKIGDKDLTQVLEQYRRQSYKAAKMLFSISDERILSLSFIFVVQPEDCYEGFLNDIEVSSEIIRSCFNTTRPINTPNEAVLITSKIDNVRHSVNAVREILAKEHVNHWDDKYIVTPYYNVINSYANYNKTLHDDHTEQDADAYEFFTREAFKDKIYNQYKMSKHLAASKEFIPDYKISYQVKKEISVDLFLIEIKKDDKQYTSAQSDFIKLHLEMQIMLNDLIKLNVKDPVVYGLLIKGCKCTLYKMSLRTVYFSFAVEIFYLPRCLADVSLIPRVLSIFMTIKDEVDSMIKAINENKRGVSPLLKYTRQGMGMPVKIRDPVSYTINIDANDYLPP